MTQRLHLFSSLSPNPKRAARQLACFESWVENGALVHLIQRVRDVKIIDPDILSNVYSYHEIDGDGPVPFVELLEEAGAYDEHVLILNADNELIVPAEKFKRFDSFVGSGLMVIPRFESKNTAERAVTDEPYDPFERLAVRGYERQGIEGIYLKITDELIAYCKRSPIEFRIGEPWWDVIVPYYYVKYAGLGDGDLWAPAGPVALHEPHKQMWNPKLSHVNGVAASAVMKIPVRNSPEELNRMHESVSCSIRNSIAYITNEMLQHDEAFRSAPVLEPQTYPKLTTAQLGDVLVGPAVALEQPALEQASTALSVEPVEDFVKAGTETVISVAESAQRIEHRLEFDSPAQLGINLAKHIEEPEQLVEGACGQQEPPNENAGPALPSEPETMPERASSRRAMSNVLGIAMLCSMLPSEMPKPQLSPKEKELLEKRKAKRDGNA